MASHAHAIVTGSRAHTASGLIENVADVGVGLPSFGPLHSSASIPTDDEDAGSTLSIMDKLILHKVQG